MNRIYISSYCTVLYCVIDLRRVTASAAMAFKAQDATGWGWGEDTSVVGGGGAAAGGGGGSGPRRSLQQQLPTTATATATARTVTLAVVPAVAEVAEVAAVAEKAPMKAPAKIATKSTTKKQASKKATKKTTKLPAGKKSAAKRKSGVRTAFSNLTTTSNSLHAHRNQRLLAHLLETKTRPLSVHANCIQDPFSDQTFTNKEALLREINSWYL